MFYHSNNIGAIDVKMGRSVVGLLLGMLGLTLSSKLDWGSYIISIVEAKKKKKIRILIWSMKFFSPEVALYLYKSTILPCVE